MSRITLLGGPLDGKTRGGIKGVPTFVWATSDPTDSMAPLRLWRSPGRDRCLYRHVGTRHGADEQERRYLYAGHQYAYCCGAFHQRPDAGGSWACMVCGESVHAAH